MHNEREILGMPPTLAWGLLGGLVIELSTDWGLLLGAACFIVSSGAVLALDWLFRHQFKPVSFTHSSYALARWLVRNGIN